MYNPGSTVKFREALKFFRGACSPMSPEQSIKSAAQVRSFTGQPDPRSCARSIACKLGSPITAPQPPPPATLAPAPHRILGPRLASGRSAAGFPYASHEKSAYVRLLALPRIAPPDFPATVSSVRKNNSCATRVCDKTRPHSSRYAPARIPASFATSSMPSLFVWSCRNIALRRILSQGGVCSTYPRRTARTRHRHRGEQREQIHGALPQTAVSDRRTFLENHAE